MNYEDTRIAKLRNYLFEVLDNLVKNKKYQINANMLSNDINSYSLDKIPTQTTINRFITGDEIHRDVYSFRSRKTYSEDVVNNLKNIGFFEEFEHAIEKYNIERILPGIEGIQSIECLNCATLLDADTKSAIFDIQIQITYLVGGSNEIT